MPAPYDGAFYAAPYYAGGRIVFYTPQIVDGRAAGDARRLRRRRASRCKTDTVSGIYAPGKDWYNALPYVWAHGGEIAVRTATEWDAQFSSEESLEGLEQLQEVYLNASIAPVDGDEADPQDRRSARARSGSSSRRPNWVNGRSGASRRARTPAAPTPTAPTSRVRRCPGMTAGETAPIFAGGSNIAIAAKSDSPEMAKAALEIMLSEGYQKLSPRTASPRESCRRRRRCRTTPIPRLRPPALANSKFTPTSPELGRGRGRADHPGRSRQDRPGRRRRGDRGGARHADRRDPQRLSPCRARPAKPAPSGLGMPGHRAGGATRRRPGPVAHPHRRRHVRRAAAMLGPAVSAIDGDAAHRPSRRAAERRATRRAGRFAPYACSIPVAHRPRAIIGWPLVPCS